MKIKAVIMAMLMVLLLVPGQAQANSIPTVFCGTVLTMPYHLIDCSNIGQENKAEVKTNQISLSEQKVLPRTASVYRTSSSPSYAGNLVSSLRELIQKIARSLNMDPRIIEAVAKAESGGNQAVISNKGAIGIMQLMPSTAKGLGVNPYDTAQNVLGGAMYLKIQMNRFGSLPLALAAYNAGPGAVQTYGGIPPYKETINYVSNVMSMLEERS